MIGGRNHSRESGFSMIELAVVCIIAVTIVSIALYQLLPAWQTARADNAARIITAQLRQAREYSIANRRYVQVQISTVANQPQIVITQKNTLTPGGGAADVVVSTVYLTAPMQLAVYAGIPDTPDGFGNSAAVAFKIEGTSTASTSYYFQSDGQFVDSTTYQPVDGTISIDSTSNQKASARAVTVMGATGRVHAWRPTGSGSTATTVWTQY